MDLKTAEKKRLFRCGEGMFESVLGFVGDSRTAIVISHETKTEPPNDFTVDLETGKRTKLTDFRDPAPELTGLKKELIKYKRDDGVPALRHALPAARLQGRHPAAPDHLGLPARVQRRRHGRPGAHRRPTRSPA